MKPSRPSKMPKPQKPESIETLLAQQMQGAERSTERRRMLQIDPILFSELLQFSKGGKKLI